MSLTLRGGGVRSLVQQNYGLNPFVHKTSFSNHDNYGSIMDLLIQTIRNAGQHMIKINVY